MNAYVFVVTIATLVTLATHIGCHGESNKEMHNTDNYCEDLSTGGFPPLGVEVHQSSDEPLNTHKLTVQSQ